MPPFERVAFASRPPSAPSVWASKRYVDLERIRQRAGERVRSQLLPGGHGRASSPRSTPPATARSPGRWTCPTLVIHGRDDTLITPERRRRTAELIPGRQPADGGRHGSRPARPLWPLLVGAIVGHADDRGRPAEVGASSTMAGPLARLPHHRARRHRARPVRRDDARRHGRRGRPGRAGAVGARAGARPRRTSTSCSAAGATSPSTSSTPTASRRCSTSSSRPTR